MLPACLASTSRWKDLKIKILFGRIEIAHVAVSVPFRQRGALAFPEPLRTNSSGSPREYKQRLGSGNIDPSVRIERAAFMPRPLTLKQSFAGQGSGPNLARRLTDGAPFRIGRLCGAGVWGLPRHVERSLSASVAIAEVRHQPWRLCYRITDSQLKGAPKYSNESWNWSDPSDARSVDDYYGGIPAP